MVQHSGTLWYWNYGIEDSPNRGGPNILAGRPKKLDFINIFAKVLFKTSLIPALNNFLNGFHIYRNNLLGIPFPYISYSKVRNYQILIYHRVNDENDPFFPAIPVSVFRKQMFYLSQNYHVMSLEEILLTGTHTRLPKNTIAITFDDGYMDNYTYAFPILKEFKLPATIFLSTGYIGVDEAIWHDRVFNAWRQTRVSSFVFEGFKYSMNTLEEKLKVQDAILDYLKRLRPGNRLKNIQRLEEQLHISKDEKPQNIMLKWPMIKEMYNHGISFGAHTVTHTILTALPIDSVRKEVYQSKEAIEDILKVPICLFAYPNGKGEDFNSEVKEIIKDAGFLGAVTTIFGTNRGFQDEFELKRIITWDFCLPSFALKLNWYKLVS